MIAIFVYGHDYNRRKAFASPSTFILDFWYVPLWFILTTVALHLFRIKYKISGKTFSSSILDMIVVSFGTGTIRYGHRIERYFIIVLLFGMFFLQSLWISDFLSKMSSLRYVNRVRTFTKVKRLHTPIYFANILGDETENVTQIIK